MSKHLLLLSILFSGFSIQAQYTYLCYDQSVSVFRISRSNSTEKINRFESKYAGGSISFFCDKRNSLSIGMGLSSIGYQKEWQGIFPESNQFGIVVVNGSIGYWSFPIAYNYIPGKAYRGPGRHYRYGRDRFRFGFKITYVPSFLGQSSFSVTTYGGADPTTFLSTFESNEQPFQHSLTFGLNDQLVLLNKHLRLELEPYIGIGSGYFKETGTNLTTLSYGLRMHIGLFAKLPRISIEKEIDSGHTEEKKKLLQKKQQEIEEQLKQNKNPK